MASDNLRRRLELLNGGPLAEPPPAVPTTEGPAWSSRSAGVSAGGSRQLEACLPGEPRLVGSDECYYHVERAASEYAPWAADVTHSVQRALTGSALLRRLPADSDAAALFLDIETLGLSPADPLFLIGLLVIDRDTARCTQLLARDPSEERAVLAALAPAAAAADLLVTFNGKSFDMPYIRGRAVVHEMDMRNAALHIDMLHESRVQFGRRLPNCRLQTLERHICGRTREGDIPGSEIPAAYRGFVETGDAAAISAIAHHNVLDLLTTAELLARVYAAD